MVAVSLKAQDCDVLLLPYFQNDREALEEYRAVAPEKIEWRCAYARSCFYVSDVVPEGAEVHKISEVRAVFSGEFLPENFEVDLNTLSVYAYNFRSFQNNYPAGNKEICFSTPASSHPYLVLRSVNQVYLLTESLVNHKNK